MLFLLPDLYYFCLSVAVNCCFFFLLLVAVVLHVTAPGLIVTPRFQ
jgi:hypothetical protein